MSRPSDDLRPILYAPTVARLDAILTRQGYREPSVQPAPGLMSNRDAARCRVALNLLDAALSAAGV